MTEYSAAPNVETLMIKIRNSSITKAEIPNCRKYLIWDFGKHSRNPLYILKIKYPPPEKTTVLPTSCNYFTGKKFLPNVLPTTFPH